MFRLLVEKKKNVAKFYEFKFSRLIFQNMQTFNEWCIPKIDTLNKRGEHIENRHREMFTGMVCICILVSGTIVWIIWILNELKILAEWNKL